MLSSTVAECHGRSGHAFRLKGGTRCPMTGSRFQASGTGKWQGFESHGGDGECVALPGLREETPWGGMYRLWIKTPEGAKKEGPAVPIIAKETGSNFKPAPAGVAMAVCCDVVDLGMLEANFPGKPPAMKHKIKIVWQLAELDAEIGKRPTVQQRYTLSLHEKAALRKDLESWRGRPFTAEERGGFDVEKVIGVPCMLNIIHHESKGNTYANVTAIMPCPKGTPKVVVAPDFVREKDRPKNAPGQVADDSDTDWMNGNERDDAEDIVPF